MKTKMRTSSPSTMRLGSDLCPEDRQQALRSFVHRFTRSNVPRWAKTLMPNGSAYPVQFEDDADWLANTRFRVRRDGRLDNRARFCESTPSWPDNPELRHIAS